MRLLVVITTLVVALVVPAGAQASGLFSASTETVPASSASSIATGDFDGDGRKDVAIAGGSSIVIRLNASDRGDARPSTGDGAVLDAGATVTDIAAGDLNQDGRDDIAAARGAGNQPRVFLSLGSSSGLGFQGTDLTVGLMVGAVEIGIGNGTADTAPDLYATSATDLIFGPSTTAAGSATWTNGATSTGSAPTPTGLTMGKFESGDADDFAATGSDGRIYLLRRPSGGTVGTLTTNLGSAVAPTTTAVGAAYQGDGDAATEVVWGYANGNLVRLNPDNAGAYVGSIVSGAITEPIRAIVAGDFDGQGDLGDVVALTSAATNRANAFDDAALAVVPTQSSLPAGTVGTASAAAVGDLNNDGALDIALANGGTAITSLTSRPRVVPSPTSLTFASQTRGLASTAQTVTLTNNGWAPLVLLGAQLSTSAEGADFFVAADDCTGVLLPFGIGSCDIRVRFDPQAAGSRSGTLSFVTPGVTQPTVALSGTAVDPAPGPQGSPGNQGANGTDGTQGVAGPNGQAGGTGPAGANGQNGATGATGGTGATGAPGKTVLANCDAIASDGRVICTLTVTAQRTATVTVRLTRGGKLYATATVKGLKRGQKLKLPSLRSVPRGNYRLEVVTRAKGKRNASKVSYPVTVR